MLLIVPYRCGGVPHGAGARAPRGPLIPVDAPAAQGFPDAVPDLRIEPVDGDAAALLTGWQHVHNLIVPAPSSVLSLDDVRERARRNHLEVAYLGDVLIGCTTVIARVLPLTAARASAAGSTPEGSPRPSNSAPTYRDGRPGVE